MESVYLPELGDEVEGATISFWHVEPGEHVDAGQDVVEVATDKSTFNVPAPIEGLLMEIVKKEGDPVESGDLLARIQEED